MDCSLPGSTIHGIFQARILEWVAISFSRRSSWPRDWTLISHIVVRRFMVWATKEVLYKILSCLNFPFLWIQDMKHFTCLIRHSYYVNCLFMPVAPFSTHLCVWVSLMLGIINPFLYLLKTCYLPIHQLMNLYIVSTFLLLQLMLWWNQHTSFCVVMCFQFSWVYTSRSRTVQPHGNSLCLPLGGTTNLFSTAAVPYYIPISTIWEIHFLHILTNTYLPFLDSSHPNVCEVVSHRGFDCISLVANGAENFFLCFCTFEYLSGEMSSYSLSILKQNSLAFYWVVEFLYSQYSSLIRYRICHCFLPFRGLSFPFLMICYEAQRLLILKFSHFCLLFLVLLIVKFLLLVWSFLFQAPSLRARFRKSFPTLRTI